MAGSNNLQVIEAKRGELQQALTQNEAVVLTLEPSQQEKFKKTFLELASQDYLLSVIPPRELIRFAVGITKIGLDIAPSANQIYIVPFDTKVNGTKVMLPQAIIPLKGLQELAYQSGFMLTVDPVYKFSETEAAAARELTRIQQSKLRTADPKWLEDHFIGYDVILKDLVGNLGEQVYFVDSSYVKEATKTNKDPRWSLSTWTHKAARKAYKQFVVPQERRIELFEKLEELNDDQLKKVDAQSYKTLDAEIEEAITALGLSLVKENGTAKVVGNTYGKEGALKDLGFVYNNRVWCMDYKEESNPSPTPQQQAPKKSPAHRLMAYLVSKGVEKAKVGEFVKGVLGLTSDDVGGIEAVLNDTDSLDTLIEEYLSGQSVIAVEAEEVF